MVTSSFSLDTSVVNRAIDRAYKDCRSSTLYVHSNHGNKSARAASLRPSSQLLVGFYLEPLDTDTVLFILGCTSAAKPVLVRRPRDSQRSLFMASMVFIVCVG